MVTHAIEHYRDDADLQNLIDSIQQNFRCCGGYSYHDWNANKHFNCSVVTVESCGVPFSCCRTVSTCTNDASSVGNMLKVLALVPRLGLDRLKASTSAHDRGV